MLSILIPTYNYDASPLVKELNKQCISEEIDYEILVVDDCSNQVFEENESLNEINNCIYQKLEKNIGRSAIRNKLASTAKFSNLLFLDVDTIPIKSDFISNYLKYLNTDFEIVYGGIRYLPNPPKTKELLRWKYGLKREALPVEKRNLKPYISFLSLNFLIKKSIFNTSTFNEDIPNLRHEDTLFAVEAKKKKIKLLHIDNPVYHLGLDTSEIFIEKSIKAIDALDLFIKKQLVKPKDTLISRTAFKLKKMGLLGIGTLFFSKFGSLLEKNLKSKTPSLVLFDIYRLGYFCSLLKNNESE
ncbi:MAG: glycosyltransferase family 2 protein [Jejuia sp.]